MTDRVCTPLVTAGHDESFTATWTSTVEGQEGDMITDPASGITYVFHQGEWRTIAEMTKQGKD